MKRKIIIGLSLYTFVFLLGGLYILKLVNDTTSKLDNLVVLHQVEILREHFLVQLRRMQTDLSVMGTRHSGDFDTVVSHGRQMAGVIGACGSCHHEPDVAVRLATLQRDTREYQDAVSRVMTIQAGPNRMAATENRAFDLGQTLIDDVNAMIAITGPRLEILTMRALGEVDRTRYALYFLVAIGPLMSLVLGTAFASGITKPLGVLVGSTRKLQQGDLDHRVDSLPGEFGELGRAVNDMAASLKDQMLQMQRTEQLAAVGELSAGLAHEIKNPLAGIKVAMHVLAEETTLPDEDRAVLVKVGEEVTRLETLMKGFLNFARPPRPQPADLDVNKSLRNTLAFFGQTHAAPRERSAPVRIDTRLEQIPPVRVDPMQLQQVMLNLLINAADAMPDGGTITVATRVEPDREFVRIEVIDTGTGIRAEHMAQLFQPFFTTKVGGTGLGLATSRQLLEHQGGSIGVAPGPNGGTVFTIRLPLASPGEDRNE